MKRIIFSLLLIIGCASMYAEPVRILGIGNSFTVDALEQHFQPLLDAEGVDAVIGYPYRGGTFLSQHDAWSTRTDTLPYNYRKFKNGNYTTTGLASYSLKMAMEDEPWDWVIIQSDHDSAGIYQSYVPYMEHLIDFVHANCSNPNVKIGFYMTWAYDATSTYSGFRLYNYNQKLMYDSIIACAQQLMAAHPELEVLIPAGTAVQNARTSYMGERLNRDGYHLHYDHGRYIAALSWYEVLLGKSALEVTWAPSSITQQCAEMCRAAVHASVQKPYEVTSLKEEFGEEEGDPIVPGTESRLKRVTVNGMSVGEIGDKTTFDVKVDYTRTPVALYAYPIDSKAELNITDVNGSDIEKDPTKPWYYPLTAPANGAKVTYTIRVISEAMGSDETIYTLNLIGAEAKDLTYPISCREDLEDFAKAVNSGSYAIHGELTKDFNMNHTKQECWMTPIGSKEKPYTGSFDGKGYTISGFNIYSVDNDLYDYTFVGLFGYIKNTVIKNLHIKGTEESYFNRPSNATDDTQNKAFAILCGCVEASTVQDCSVSMPIFTNVSGHVGMLVGKNADVSGAPASVIERCSVQGTWRIRHKGIYGGILGYGYNCVIRDCYSLCKMELQQDKGARIGGILGYCKSSSNARSIKIENCYNYGTLKEFSSTPANTPSIGAIAGVFNGTKVTMNNCWYLDGSASKAIGTQDNTQQATKATKEQFADGTVTKALGAAWEQGDDYPVLKAPVVTPTGMEEIECGKSEIRKLLRNGQLLIQREGELFTVMGQRF